MTLATSTLRPERASDSFKPLNKSDASYKLYIDMPHQRFRYLENLLRLSLKASPIVGLMGQRQTGKTTLAARISKDYLTLDDEETLELALRTPKNFLEGRKSPTSVDECQQSAPLFPALKEHVRKNPGYGQFLLTGSVRFTSVETIKESLTGRMIELELLPLCLTELHQRPLTDPRAFLKAKNPIPLLTAHFQKNAFKSPDLMDFLKKGGLPGICFLRSDTLRVRKTRTQLKTILDRDLRMVTRTTLDYLTLKTFLEEIALQQGDPFDLSKAARGARIALNSARKLLSGLESTYLIRSILKTGETQGRLIYLEDQGTASFLLRERGISTEQMRVADLNRLLFQQLYAQLNYGRDGGGGSLTHFRLKNGALIDFVMALPDTGMLAYSVGTGSTASPQQIGSARSFLARYPAARVLLLHQGQQFREVAPGVIECPFSSVL